MIPLPTSESLYKLDKLQMNNEYKDYDVPQQASPVFETIERIDKKLESLSLRLSPIIEARPEKGDKRMGEGTQLTENLNRIEDKVTAILDSIVL